MTNRTETLRQPCIEDVRTLQQAASTSDTKRIIPQIVEVLSRIVAECYWDTCLSLPETVLADPVIMDGTIYMNSEAFMEDVDCNTLEPQFKRDLANNLWNEIQEYINIENSL